MTHLFTEQNTQFDAKLKAWLEGCQKMINKHYAENLTNLTPDELSIDPKGRKFCRIVREGNQRCVFAFIDKKTGDILKPATWASPAKHARGNIFDASGGMGRMTVYGPEYLK